MLKGAIKCPDCEGSSMNKLTCRASSKHGGGTYTYYRCTGTGSRRKGCGNMVRMEVVDAAVNEIMATTFGVPVKRLILVKGDRLPGSAGRDQLPDQGAGSGRHV